MFRTLMTLGIALTMTSVHAAASDRSDEQSRPTVATEGPVRMARAQPGGPDFLFGRPHASLGIRWQWVRARAESEIFGFVSEQLTLERRDFDTQGVIVDVGFPLTARLDVLGALDFSRASAMSNYRDFVDADGGEIEQTTRFRQVRISAGLELALTPRGRSIGQYAWIPARVTPYVGAGVGMMWYRFEQAGDFVDFVDQSIFTSLLLSEGWTPDTHVAGGVDVRLTRRIQLTVETEYRWASAGMSEDFVDFDDIDLTGLRLSTGVQFSF